MYGLRGDNIIKYFAIRYNGGGGLVARGLYSEYINILHNPLEKKSKVTEFLQKAWGGASRILSVPYVFFNIFLKKTIKRILKVLLYLLILFLLVAGSLHIPFIQTIASQFLASQLSERTGFETTIQNVHVRWWDALSVQGLVVRDPQDSLMANLESVYVDFSPSTILDPNQPGIDEIQLKGGELRFLTHEGNRLPNISHFINELNGIFAPKKNKTRESTSQFSISRMSFEKIGRAHV